MNKTDKTSLSYGVCILVYSDNNKIDMSVYRIRCDVSWREIKQWSRVGSIREGVLQC